MYKKNDFLLKKKIKFYTKNFLKNITFTKNIEHYDLNLLIRKKYYKDRVLLFGDALHRVHPFTGQGFNMILRDLANLENTLKNKIALGLDIGSARCIIRIFASNKTKKFSLFISNRFYKKFFFNPRKKF